MLCQKCGKKEAAVHVVCMVNNKQIDKWLGGGLCRKADAVRRQRRRACC